MKQTCLKLLEKLASQFTALCVMLVLCLPAYSNDTKDHNEYNYWQQEVHGIISDSKGKPLADVTVAVKGSRISSVSKPDGSFSISAKKGDILGHRG